MGNNKVLFFFLGRGKTIFENVRNFAYNPPALAGFKRSQNRICNLERDFWDFFFFIFFSFTSAWGVDHTSKLEIHHGRDKWALMFTQPLIILEMSNDDWVIITEIDKRSRARTWWGIYFFEKFKGNYFFEVIIGRLWDLKYFAL